MKFNNPWARNRWAEPEEQAKVLEQEWVEVEGTSTDNSQVPPGCNILANLNDNVLVFDDKDKRKKILQDKSYELSEGIYFDIYLKYRITAITTSGSIDNFVLVTHGGGGEAPGIIWLRYADLNSIGAWITIETLNDYLTLSKSEFCKKHTWANDEWQSLNGETLYAEIRHFKSLIMRVKQKIVIAGCSAAKGTEGKRLCKAISKWNDTVSFYVSTNDIGVAGTKVKRLFGNWAVFEAGRLVEEIKGIIELGYQNGENPVSIIPQ